MTREILLDGLGTWAVATFSLNVGLPQRHLCSYVGEVASS
jgi:hypothetical protein